MSKLTDKQRRFVAEYLVDLNATQAAMRAGYSAKTAAEQASRLLTNVKVKAAIEAGQKKTATKLEITKERIVEELAKLAFSNMQDYMRSTADGDPYLDFSNLTREQAAALAEVTVEDFTDGRGEDARQVRRVKFKLHDKKGSLVDLAKMMGFTTEKTEVMHQVGDSVKSLMEAIDGRTRSK